MLLFRALILNLVDEAGIEDTYPFWHLRSRTNLKYALFQETGDFSLLGIVI
jgi:hypothetical protein